TPSSSRSWPELPPLSNIVTTALRCNQGLVLSPPRRLGSPVPPPKQPMFSSRSCIWPILNHEPRRHREHGDSLRAFASPWPVIARDADSFLQLTDLHLQHAID